MNYMFLILKKILFKIQTFVLTWATDDPIGGQGYFID